MSRRRDAIKAENEILLSDRNGKQRQNNMRCHPKNE